MTDFTEAWLAAEWKPERFLSKTVTSEEEIANLNRLGIRLHTETVDRLQEIENGEDEDWTEDDSEDGLEALSEFDTESEHETEPNNGNGQNAGENLAAPVADTTKESANNKGAAGDHQLEQTGIEDELVEDCDNYNGQTIEGFDDVEVAEILREAARVNGLDNYDVWFDMIGRPDPRLAGPRTGH
ncbi:hypothetical protein H2200_010902 [Cladophialophora chaetospira]|uniref:Uncharacterized protein n=1 Tax=Cladophialophora chaetospira TaxID=386627 RepID=A0AA38X146_9EURO|nr:hypothetical protein H2200_010902 [Cladophialophora chaetospira]